MVCWNHDDFGSGGVAEMILTQKRLAQAIALPSADDVRNARIFANLTQEQAGALVTKAKKPGRTWSSWEVISGVNKRQMPIAEWCLFLIETDQVERWLKD